MDPERFELCAAPCKGLDLLNEKKHPCGCFCVDPERFELCAAPCKGLDFSINKKAPLRMLLCGPREIRTLDLLNAIETRSQLRYGPLLTTFTCFPWRSQFPGKGTACAMGPCLLVQLFPIALPIPRKGTMCAMGTHYSNGPGGIRTLDLFSAIEARSQLRYRPVLHPDFKNKHFNGLMQECQAFLGCYCCSPTVDGMGVEQCRGGSDPNIHYMQGEKNQLVKLVFD